MSTEVLQPLLPAFVWLPILAGGIALAVRRSVVAQRVVAFSAHTAMLVGAVVGLVAVSGGDLVVEQVSGWVPGVSIPFVLDTFAALMLTVAALMVLVCSVFAVLTHDDVDPFFHPLVLVLSAGVLGAFLTGDLFNLFVMIEVALIPSYVLLTRSGSAAAVGAGRIYFGVNLLVSGVLLSGIGLVYGAAGTVNLAELAGRASDSTAVALAAGVVLLALGAKAALVPVHSWLPRSYPFASVAVTALLSGLLTKIGVYGVFRVYGLLHDGRGLETVWLVVLLATMVVGVLGALGESTMRAVLSFHMTSQVGYIMVPLAFFGPLAMAAGIFYMVHHIIVKAALFLACGAVEHHARSGRLSHLGGYARREPWLGLVFIVSALSLVGIPPLSGFVAKALVIRESLSAGLYVAAAFAVVVSLLTLLSMLKIWNGVFWGPDPEFEREGPLDTAATAPDVTDPSSGRLRPEFVTARVQRPTRVPRRLIVPAAFLAACTVTIGLGAEVLLELSMTAGEGLSDSTAYVEAVLTP